MEIFLPCPVLRCGDRHLGVKVEVSIRQRRFVGLIGHPHVFVPIMGLRAEGPAGLRAHRWAQTSADQVARLSQCSAQLCRILIVLQIYMLVTLTQFLEARNCFL